MMNTLRKRALCLLLALVLALTAAPAALADQSAEAEAEAVQAVVRYGPEAGREELDAALAALEGVEVLWRYDALFAGAAIRAGGDALERAAALDGVETVSPCGGFYRPQTIQEPLESSNSLPMMVSGPLAYTGDGMVVAVLDSGFRTTHAAFADNGLARAPAISQADVAAFAADGGTPGAYLSARIPFAFDYAGGDRDVSGADDHGTHVAALAVGCARDGDGAVVFQGVAPAAQLLAMKVFPDSGGGQASDAVILRALEDALLLGADVINLSLGADNGFTRDPALERIYGDVFQRLREAGILVCAAAGNGGSPVLSRSGTALPSGGYTDYGSVASPGVYEGVLSVAAADAMACQESGCLSAGERTLAYTPAVSETGLDLPGLERLAGQTLPYAVVGGTGRAEDYRGLDLGGKIALVARGEITFTEKVENAAAAGAAACLICNSAAGSMIPVAESAAIPCAALSMEDGGYLRQLAGEAGQGRLTVAAGDRMTALHDAPVPLAQSAWGPASDLRLVPQIAAPGGSILSASAAGDSLYQQLSGTSMASPNAAGALALLLEKLGREQPEVSPQQRAELALALLESAARPMTEADGTPVSPRKQGAGLIDLTAALEARAVILDPILELGEGSAFTASFTVRSLWDQPLALTVDAAVSTDAYDVRNGRSCSLMTAMDVTDRCAVGGGSAVTLAPGEERTVTVRLQPGTELRRELGEVYPNGFYLEGFLTLLDGGEPAAHAAFLGYCGDWEKAPILEEPDPTGGAEPELGANLVHVTGLSLDDGEAPLLGENPWSAGNCDERRAALSAGNTDAFYTAGGAFTVSTYLLRNAAHLVMAVSDAESGRIYYVSDQSYLPRSGADPLSGAILPSGRFSWTGVDSRGDPVPGGVRVNVSFYGWLDHDEAMAAAYDRADCDRARPETYRWILSDSWNSRLQWRFSLTMDAAAPVLTGEASYDEGTGVLTLPLRDDQYLAYAAVRDGDGTLLAEETFAGDRPGREETLAVDLGGLTAPPEVLYITAADYASNTVGLRLDLETLTAEPCPMGLLTDVDLNAWYHDAVDAVYARKLMEGSEPLTFQPEETATRAHLLEALYRLVGSPETEEGAFPFTDVPVSSSYRAACHWAYENGLTGGVNEAVLGAFLPLRRQELAVILQRFAALDGQAAPESALTCADSGQLESWAIPAAAWAVEEGYLTLDGQGRLDPRGYVSRAALAQVLARWLEA